MKKFSKSHGYAHHSFSNPLWLLGDQNDDLAGADLIV